MDEASALRIESRRLRLALQGLFDACRHIAFSEDSPMGVAGKVLAETGHISGAVEQPKTFRSLPEDDDDDGEDIPF